MALKDLYKMTKADRYTQDGREELNKAREAATEDARRIYKNGEISETTGLMKTPNGWVPPTETKFGKVKQNKEGQWGVQTKQGKGSDFLKHKSEKEAKRALSNYTRGYNTTERSKQDPHSDYARQQKQWNKETEKIRKNNNAERRAEHASHFQENKPVLSQTDGKGNKVEIKITESKGGGFYIDKYVNGKHIGINNANTRESAKAKAKSMMEQHMADPDFRAESKPLQHTSASPKVQESVYKDIKNNGLEDYTVEEIAKEYGTTRGDAEAIRARLNKDKLLDSLSFDLVDTTADIEEEYNAVEHSDNSRLPEFVRQQVENEYVNKINGEKWSDEEKDIIAEEVTRRIKERQSKDAAPRQLTGDCKIRIRK